MGFRRVLCVASVWLLMISPSRGSERNCTSALGRMSGNGWIDLSRFNPNDPEQFHSLFSREWLLSNGRGGFASGTVLGIPTRRYHGLLIAPAMPPAQRWMLFHSLMERLQVGNQTLELSNFDFADAIHPQGYRYLTGFATRNHPQTPWARWEYRGPGFRLRKEVMMKAGEDTVWIRYRLQSERGEPVSLWVAPLVGFRDFHSDVRRGDDYHVSHVGDEVAIDSFFEGPRLILKAKRNDGGNPVHYQHTPGWWTNFFYSTEAARGLGAREDLFLPGWFSSTDQSTIDLTIRASAKFWNPFSVESSDEAPGTRQPLPDLPSSVTERLRDAARSFVVKKDRPHGGPLTTILAGYHWFGDWGRDTFIAMPGLLLLNNRFEDAKKVLEVFASVQTDGLIPNRFSDSGTPEDMNSIDASLWYIHSAHKYAQASGDHQIWVGPIGRACEQVIEAYIRGTRFNIHMDSDGLIAGGDPGTNLTWMDAKHSGITFTSRHGKPVEINALWYHALTVTSQNLAAIDPSRSTRYAKLASQVGESFRREFWNAERNCLYDVVRDSFKDSSIRPNQIFAVSLPNSPLTDAQKRGVLETVKRELLTPFGLRSLAPSDPAYRGVYQGTMFERDSAYHQGTVWVWLIGSYVEGYLRVHGFSAEAKREMRKQLQPLIEHLDEAGIGSVSEIFDGNPPFQPRGCISQAWSVSEVLRAWQMTATDIQ